MLKKAGIVAAASVAALVALSPLAFASGPGHHHDGNVNIEKSSRSTDDDSASNNSGPLSGNNVSIPLNVCDNQVPVNDSSALNDLTGALGVGVLGNGTATTSATDASVTDDSCKADSAIDDGDAVGTNG